MSEKSQREEKVEISPDQKSVWVCLEIKDQEIAEWILNFEEGQRVEEIKRALKIGVLAVISVFAGNVNTLLTKFVEAGAKEALRQIVIEEITPHIDKMKEQLQAPGIGKVFEEAQVKSFLDTLTRGAGDHLEHLGTVPEKDGSKKGDYRISVLINPSPQSYPNSGGGRSPGRKSCGQTVPSEEIAGYIIIEAKWRKEEKKPYSFEDAKEIIRKALDTRLADLSKEKPAVGILIIAHEKHTPTGYSFVILDYPDGHERGKIVVAWGVDIAYAYRLARIWIIEEYLRRKSNSESRIQLEGALDKIRQFRERIQEALEKLNNAKQKAKNIQEEAQKIEEDLTQIAIDQLEKSVSSAERIISDILNNPLFWQRSSDEMIPASENG